jgi:hypothetical protein
VSGRRERQFRPAERWQRGRASHAHGPSNPDTLIRLTNLKRSARTLPGSGRHGPAALVTPSFQGPGHASTNPFGGARRGRFEVSATPFAQDTVKAPQLDLHPALFIHAASRTVDVSHANRDPLDFRPEAPQREMQPPRDELVQRFAYSGFVADDLEFHCVLLSKSGHRFHPITLFLFTGGYIDK